MVARLRARIERAAALHRTAAAVVAAAAPVLDAYAPVSAPADQYAEQHDLAAGLRANAASLAPGWLSAPLDALAPTTPLGGPLPTFVRVGQAQPLDDARFGVVVPLLRAGHVAVDADARDRRVAGLLRSLVLRLLASSPPGAVHIRTVDATDVGATFSAFTGIDRFMPPPATDADGLRTVLEEAERWLAARADGPGPALLVVIASLPELTEGRDLARIAALAHAGPAGRLHLIAAGWPPPPLTAETTQAPLPHATQIALRNPYAWVGDPPGTTFAANGVGPGRLNAPVYLDPDPPLELIREVCAQLAAARSTPRASMGEPSRTAWLEYSAAAQRLDAVRRDAAAVVAEHTAALKVAREDLAGVQAKLAQHQAHLADAARSAGGKAVELAPGWTEAQAAQAMLAGQPPAPGHRGNTRPQPVQHPPRLVSAPPFPPGPPISAPPYATGPHPISAPPVPQRSGLIGAMPAATGAVGGAPTLTRPLSPAGTGPINLPARDSVPGRVSLALRQIGAALAESETALVEGDARPAATGPRVGRNLFVYAAFAAFAALIQVPMLIALARDEQLGIVALPCGLVLPVVSFALGWLTVGALSRGSAGRTPLLGALVSLIALVPVLVFLGWLFAGLLSGR